MIVSVANQKGGVGKTTLCMLFANYLVKEKRDVLVLDCDRQKSILAQRNSDQEAFTDQEESYNVEDFEIDDMEQTSAMLEQAKEIEGIVLIDTPGSVSDDGLIPIFTQSNIIICPYQYERRCLESTGVFLQILHALKDKYPNMNPKIFFVPNRVDKRIGTKDENSLWEDTDNIFKQFGSVTPPVSYKSSIMRANTYVLTPGQEQDVKECFDFIIKEGNIL